MVDFAKEVISVNIEDELKQSYLDYAMSVIVGRALPDVRDGLKPVHRRVLFAMHELNNTYDKPYKKSARVVGDVIGKYHPHGDTAVYDTIVRMAQPFAMRYVLIDGQGNFGSIDGDSPAAMRYTEVRMAKIAHSVLEDLDKETVDFAPNYDESEFAPTVLPTRVPTLLVNGTSGIAVGMATNIPPHNLTEVINACLALLDNAELSINELIDYIQGPDFPTAAMIEGRSGIIQAYKTGRGRISIKARTEIETDEKSNKQQIIIHELPYQINKARLVEKIAHLVKDKKIEGITGLRDESDKQGMRVVIELRRGELPDVVLNNLYAHTELQHFYGINMVALLGGQPRTLNLKEILEAFLQHRREVVTRRTMFELRKAKEKGHVLEGLGVALVNIDEMIALIKSSPTPAAAKEGLLAKTWRAGMVREMLARTAVDVCRPQELTAEYGLHDESYRLSPLQAQAILELRLHRLTALEQDKILQDYQQLLDLIRNLLEILGNPDRLREVIREELTAIKTEFGDKRLTEIIGEREDLLMEDLITEEEVVVTFSHEGYVKYQPLTVYQTQHRGGRGKAATAVKEEDFVERLVIASTHDTLLCFSNHGKVYWLKVYQLPAATRTARGRPIINLLPLAEGEKLNAILPVKNYDESKHVFMATTKGVVKKVSLEQFSRPRSNGIIAVELDEGDKLIDVAITDGTQNVMLFSNKGKVVQFPEALVRAMGRGARGVRGMKLGKDQSLIALIISKPEGSILTATENGYGKRTEIEDYPQSAGRGGQGVISIQVDKRNGDVVNAVQVLPNDEAMLISERGTLVRVPVNEISIVGRNTKGVRLINLTEGDKLVGMQRIEELPESGEGDVASDTVEEIAE